MTTSVVPQRPKHVPLHRWPWAWVVVANAIATVTLVVLDYAFGVWK